MYGGLLGHDVRSFGPKMVSSKRRHFFYLKVVIVVRTLS